MTSPGCGRRSGRRRGCPAGGRGPADRRHRGRRIHDAGPGQGRPAVRSLRIRPGRRGMAGHRGHGEPTGGTVRGSRCPAQRGHLGACLARPSPVRGVPARGHIHPGLMARARRLVLPDQEGRGEPAQPEPGAAAAAGSRRARQARHDGARQLPGPPVRPAPGSGQRRRNELSRLRGAPVPGRHAPHLRGGDGGRVQPGRPGQADAGDRAAGAW